MTQYPPLSRDPAEQPTVIVPDMPVSGRSTPRPKPLPDDFRHDLWFTPVIDQLTGGAYIRAACQPCGSSSNLDEHDLPDLINLYVQHAGLDAAKTLCIETLARLGASDLEPHVDVASDLPPGSRCVKCGATEGIWRLSHPVTHVMGTWCREVLPCEQRVTARQATA